MGRELPAGRVTFVFTDVVGSTRSFARFGELYVAALRRMHETIAAAADAAGGAVVSTEGDGAFLAFPTAPAALAALAHVQEQLEAEAAAAARDPHALMLRIRAGAHTGHATPLGDEYVSLAVHHAARVAATANAGQLIVAESVQHDLDAPCGERLGAFRLKDIAEPVVLWRVLGDDTPPRAEPARRTNVAAARTSFIGRQRELDVLAQLLRPPGIVTVIGPGGLGKSRLVSEFAHADAERRPGGAWVAELTAVHDPEQVTAAVAAALGVEATTTDVLARELERRGEVLLVLDGCEHLVDAAADLVAELAETCPQLRIIATSREALEIDGEQVLRLHPLDSGAGDRPGLAERLFLERAAAAGAAVSDGDLATVTRICRQLDGLPLALELAAARASSMPVSELADALDAGELQLSRRSGHRHHRTLRELVAWSLRLLDDAERTALLALSVFPGRFAAADAKELLAEVPDARTTALPELARRSLVDLDGDRYRLLLTIRDVAGAERRAQPSLDQAAHRALVRWALDGCPPRGARSRADPDIDTVRSVQTALRWGLDAGLPVLSPLMRRLRSWAQENGDTVGVRELALRILDRPLPETADEVVLQCAAAEVVVGLGWSTTVSEHLAQRIREMIEAADSTADPVAQYEANAAAALTLSKMGEHTAAMAASQAALALTEREPEVRYGRGIELGNTALVYFVEGDLETAEQYLRRAIEVNREDGDNVNQAVNRCNLGELLLDREQHAAAEQELRTALRLSRVRLPYTVGMALLVEALAAQGAVSEARTLAHEAVPALTELAVHDPSLAAQRDRLAEAVRKLD